MLSAALAVLACLCLARGPPLAAASVFRSSSIHSKEFSEILASIDERLNVLNTITAVQAKQARTIEVIQEKLDRVEMTVSLRLERAQLAAERLEHRLHMLQTNIQGSIKESNDKTQRGEMKIADIAKNLTRDIAEHKQLLQTVNGAYVDTWRRGLLLENMVRDGLSMVNATRREIAAGFTDLTRKQRDINSVEILPILTKRLKDNTHTIDTKLHGILSTQRQLLESCQRAQHDDPHHVTNVLDKLIDSLINKTATTFKELQNIQAAIRNHDSKVMKLITTRPMQSDNSCRRLESAFKEINQSTFKETELQQLTEKFVALTDRADAALQRLEFRMASFGKIFNQDVSLLQSKLPSHRSEEESYSQQKSSPQLALFQPLTTKTTLLQTPYPQSTSDITAEADRLLLKLKGIKDEEEEEGWYDFEARYNKFGNIFDVSNESDQGKDKDLQTKMRKGRQVTKRPEHRSSHLRMTVPTPSLHRRHLHKNPYDRGPKHTSNKLP